MPQKTTKEDPASGKYVRYGLQGAILCVLATAVVLFLTVEPETWSHLSEFNWWFAPVIVLTIIVAWLCNGGRIFVISRALGHRLTYAQAVSVSLSTEFGIVLLFWRAATYHLYLIGGGCLFFYLGGHMRKVFPDGPAR